MNVFFFPCRIFYCWFFLLNYLWRTISLLQRSGFFGSVVLRLVVCCTQEMFIKDFFTTCISPLKSQLKSRLAEQWYVWELFNFHDKIWSIATVFLLSWYLRSKHLRCDDWVTCPVNLTSKFHFLLYILFWVSGSNSITYMWGVGLPSRHQAVLGLQQNSPTVTLWYSLPGGSIRFPGGRVQSYQTAPTPPCPPTSDATCKPKLSPEFPTSQL